jgi:hypothetical protein
LSKADATDPSVIDTLAAQDDPDQPNHRSAPRIVPDHGAQPRLKRPTAAIYRLDPHNRYRPVGDPAGIYADGDSLYSDNRRFSKENEIFRLLMKTAKAAGPRLSSYRDDAIARVMEREVLPDACFIAKSLPPEVRSRVLDRFTAALRVEISLIKKNRRITKI